mgnify:CR=1 FL=1
MTNANTKAVETKAVKAEKTTKPLNHTAQKVVDYLTAHKGEAYTLAEIAKAVGVELKSSGAITRLLKSEKNPNGLIVHGAEVEKEVKVKRKVKTYKID